MAGKANVLMQLTCLTFVMMTQSKSGGYALADATNVKKILLDEYNDWNLPFAYPFGIRAVHG